MHSLESICGCLALFMIAQCSCKSHVDGGIRRSSSHIFACVQDSLMCEVDRKRVSQGVCCGGMNSGQSGRANVPLERVAINQSIAVIPGSIKILLPWITRGKSTEMFIII